MDEELNKIWEETERYIAKGSGIHIKVVSSNTKAWYNVDFNGNLCEDCVITVPSVDLAKVVMMFFRPDANPETVHLWESWLKREGVPEVKADENLSKYLLEFRSENKERLFAIAKHMLMSGKYHIPPAEAKTVTIKVAPKVKPKPIHKNSAVVGTAAATASAGVLSYLHHLPHSLGLVIVGIIALILAMYEHVNVNQLLQDIEE